MDSALLVVWLMYFTVIGFAIGGIGSIVLFILFALRIVE